MSDGMDGKAVERGEREGGREDSSRTLCEMVTRTWKSSVMCVCVCVCVCVSKP